MTWITETTNGKKEIKWQEEPRPEAAPLDCANQPAPPLQMAVSNTGSLASDAEGPCAGLRSFHFPLSSPATPTAADGGAVPFSSSGAAAATATALSPFPAPHSSPVPETRLSMSKKWPSDVGMRMSSLHILHQPPPPELRQRRRLHFRRHLHPSASCVRVRGLCLSSPASCPSCSCPCPCPCSSSSRDTPISVPSVAPAPFAVRDLFPFLISPSFFLPRQHELVVDALGLGDDDPLEEAGPPADLPSEGPSRLPSASSTISFIKE